MLSDLQDKLAAVYIELGDESLKPVLYRVLIEHPLIQDLVVACKSFKALVSVCVRYTVLFSVMNSVVLK